MGQRGEHIALKFRIYDGTDIGINTYAPSMTVSSLKKRLLDVSITAAKTVTPKSVDEVKIIHGGKVLENSKTLADSRITTGNQTGEAVIMHAVVQPLVPKNKRTGKKQKDMQKMNSCSCTLL
ncbi:membrane-anchored ubiquitin-fold protein 3-like isoform X1 [Malus sylvestris]|uniref:membrane-anchored ubiquitin-fold protein 3-like isoform X1 n=1 Tax=Malus sylvestris TaxID=3752 RepID=UPI0021ABE25B|nr:membrane-anchored ubiquitin-fold protein 3-like isoform X1 [Malus sylvestris]